MARVVVTGAEQGLGLEMARLYAADGHEVVAGCLIVERPGIMALAADFQSTRVLPLDVTSESSVAAFRDRLGEEPLDILINNAGIHRRKGSVPEEVVFSDWEETLRVNTLGPARVSFALRPHLRRAGRSKLVTISSDFGSVTRHPGIAYDYCSSKAAVNSLMRGLALNWAADGVTVLMIHPGWTRTAMGGADAPALPAENAALVKLVIDRATAADNGRFLDNSARDMPW
jgi:NAD(P)-dependent dehydrogenase (short-subunit alcohol dehydrogenase family)